MIKPSWANSWIWKRIQFNKTTKHSKNKKFRTIMTTLTRETISKRQTRQLNSHLLSLINNMLPQIRSICTMRARGKEHKIQGLWLLPTLLGQCRHMVRLVYFLDRALSQPAKQTIRSLSIFVLELGHRVTLTHTSLEMIINLLFHQDLGVEALIDQSSQMM